MMKKYLMTGIAAIALSAAMTSCSKSDDVYNPNAKVENTANQAVEKYNQAFLNYVGANSAADIPSNQTWGFGGYEVSGTRANTFMNGNEEKYYNAPTVGETEETDVEAYVHALTVLPAKAAPDWETYFVTQIHGGYETYNTQNSVDNSNTYVAGNQMDELAFAMQAGAVIKDDGSLEGDWIHINNFNSSDNTDWNGNTLVENGGTVDFAYKSTIDSKYHNRWIGIDGADIDEKYKDYYYICFDLEATNDQAQTNFSVKWTDEGGNHDVNVNNVPGAWSIETATAANLVLNVNGTPVTVGDSNYNITVTQLVGGNKVVEGNNDYTDWIVRLYKAVEKDSDPDNVCIIAEDLSATDDTDFDFNDVVFTVEYTSETSATVTIYAAGGTLPLTVAGHEVHGVLGSEYAQPDPETGLYKMINTGAKADVNDVAPQSFSVTGIQKSRRGADIKILVDKGSKNEEGVYVADWKELTATGGEPAAKLCVGTDFATGKKWCAERESIKVKYRLFTEWVLNNPTRIWWR